MGFQSATRSVEDAVRRRAEQAAEVHETKSMRLEEARQRCVDDFWGLPTAWAYCRRLEAYRLKVWQARTSDRRRRMVQVKNSDAATAAETDFIRNEGTNEPWRRDWLQGKS
jgi:hypothetical protein